MRKLIIGCGYLGRRVAEAWLNGGDDTFALTRSEARAEDFAKAGLKPVIGDVTRPESLVALPEVDTVLYAVGFDRGAGPSKEDVYVTGLENTLSILAGRVRRFLYVSSTSVYGQNSGEWIDEDSACRPESDGGRICLRAEEIVRRVFPGKSAGGASANILRCAGLYGPGRLLRRVSQLKAAEPIAGNPDAYLNLIHIDDAAGAVSACEQHGTPGATYLVCDGQSLTRRVYYQTLARLAGETPPVFAEAGETSTGLNKRCANTRLLRELGLVLKFPNAETGLRHALDAESSS